MEHISVEEFLNQTEKVREFLLKWWEPKTFDLYAILDSSDNKWYELSIWNDRIKYSKVIINKDCIPLLQMHQLVRIIEDRANSKLNIEFDKKLGYMFYFNLNQEKDLVTNEIHKYVTNEFDLLQALWKTVIKTIAN